MERSVILGKPTDWWAEWSSTILLIAGVALTAYNIFPLNLYVSLAGNLGWLLVGYMWRKWSLVIVEIVITVIYIAGMINVLWPPL